MAFTKMAFSPPDGLNNTSTYPATPASEAAARAQVQDPLDQLKTYINETLIPQLEATAEGQSGAHKIGSAEISGVTGENIYAQIENLKAQIDGVSQGAVPDASITNAKLAADAVETDNIKNGAVTQEKLSDDIELGVEDGAVTTAKLADGSVTADKIDTGAVTAGKIGIGAVTEDKIGIGAVTKTKLAQNALAWTLVLDEALNTGSGNISMANQAGKSEMLIQLRSSDGLAVYGSVTAPLNSEGRTMPYMHVFCAYSPADYSVDYRMVTVGTAQISYTSSRAETLGGSTNLKRICVFVR
ncbi:MAG: hypothetical protein M0R40_10970 [Firmicutes bacterium]|nr:hypothetical protein [Bacillota bacterium]